MQDRRGAGVDCRGSENETPFSTAPDVSGCENFCDATWFVDALTVGLKVLIGKKR
jgi:hypothetical protein